MKMKHIAVAFAATLAPHAATAEEMANSMTIISWGGAWQAAVDKAYVQPYLAQNPGLSVQWDESSAEAVAKLRAMDEANNLTADVLDTIASDAIRICDEGLGVEIDPDDMLASAPDGTPASVDYGQTIVSDCMASGVVYSTTVGYRTDVADWNGQSPESICALFDLESFPGKRALEKRPIGNLEWALMCDGVSKDEVYDVLSTEEGVERALGKLATIKESTVWWTAGSETPQLLADGEVVMGSTYNGRLFSMIAEQNQPVAMLWDAQVFDVGGWVIPEGLPADRLARAKDFVRFATDTEQLKNISSYIAYGPARASSAAQVGKHAELGIDMAPHMPTNAENSKNVLLYNYEWWADQRDALDQRFQAWLVQ